MRLSIRALLTLVAAAVLLPVHAEQTRSHAARAPSCFELADLILKKSDALSATAAITPATGTVPAYCQVNFTLPEAINIRVGLPLSTADGGSGGVQGAWNGKVQNLGGGGFAGSVGPVTGPVATGYRRAQLLERLLDRRPPGLRDGA